MVRHMLLSKRIISIILCVIGLVLLGYSTQLEVSGAPSEPRDVPLGPVPEPPPGFIVVPPSQLAVGAQQITLDVPEYVWQDGCGPTATAMLLGYYDKLYDMDLLEGDPNSQGSITQSISSQEHLDDYAKGPNDEYYDEHEPEPIPDKSELGGAHSDNCIADFEKTSWSSEDNKYGWTWFAQGSQPVLAQAIQDYAEYRGVGLAYQSLWFEDITFNTLKTEIDEGRPFLAAVDSDEDGYSDHFVTGYGYSTDGKIGWKTTWPSPVHWETFHEADPNDDWGVVAVILIEVVPPTCESPGAFTCFGDDKYVCTEGHWKLYEKDGCLTFFERIGAAAAPITYAGLAGCLLIVPAFGTAKPTLRTFLISCGIALAVIIFVLFQYGYITLAW